MSAIKEALLDVEGDILELQVVAYGLPEHHKVKAAITGGHIITLHISSGVLSIHHNKLGGLGRMPADQYTNQATVRTMREAYTRAALAALGV